MKKRRLKLLSLVLAAGMTVPSIAPALPVAAAPQGESQEDAQQEKKVDRLAEEEAFRGLAAQYYTTRGSGRNVVFDQLKSNTIDYYLNYSDMDGKLATQTGQSDAAGVRWTGRLKVPETGYYTFYGYADNGIRVWVDDELLIDYWDGGSWDALQTSKAVYLEADRYYNFRTDYFDYEGGSHVTLSWKNDGSITERTAIPASAYYLPENYAVSYTHLTLPTT